MSVLGAVFSCSILILKTIGVTCCQNDTSDVVLAELILLEEKTPKISSAVSETRLKVTDKIRECYFPSMRTENSGLTVLSSVRTDIR